MKKNNYWINREKAEKAWQIEQEKNLKKYNKKLGDLYQIAIDNINKDIKADIGFADGHLIKADAMKGYESLAKEVVAKAQDMMKAGHHVTRKDFSKDVNDRLKVYNASMRVNRNEILKSKIGAHLVKLGIDEEVSLTNELWDAYTKEKERQAGILRNTTKNNVWTSKEVQQQIAKQTAGANFSKRVWADVDGLKGQIDGLISTAIIRGDNPKEMAKWLTGMVSATIGNQKYVAERLARTETARVQFAAQKMSVIQGGYKYVKWFAEGEACKACKAIAGDDVGYGDGIYPYNEVPDIPVHPNCMCSISAYWVDKNPKNDVELQDQYLNAQLNGSLGGEDAFNIAKIIDQAPKTLKDVWMKYRDQLKFISYDDKKGTSFYMPNQGVTIHRSSMNLPDDPKYYQKKYDVFFHEFGHMIDHLAGDAIPNTEQLGFYKNVSSWILDSMDQDWNNLVNSKYQKLITNLKFSKIENGKGEVEGHSGWWLKVKKNGEPYTSSLKQVRLQAIEDLMNDIRTETKSNSLQDKGDLSDFLSGFGLEYPLGVGHPRSYWKRAGKRGKAAEAWAELTSATMNNPNSEKLLKKYFPETVKKYHETLERIVQND